MTKAGPSLLTSTKYTNKDRAPDLQPLPHHRISLTSSMIFSLLWSWFRSAEWAYESILIP